jgi:hypothetical protein
MLPNHSPLIVAEQFGTLAHLYPNRIDLGLGRAPGTDQATAQAIRSDFMKAAQSFPEEVTKSPGISAFPFPGSTLYDGWGQCLCGRYR